MKKYLSHALFRIHNLSYLGRTVWSVTSRALDKNIFQGLVILKYSWIVRVGAGVGEWGWAGSFLFNLTDVSVLDRQSVTMLPKC